MTQLLWILVPAAFTSPKALQSPTSTVLLPRSALAQHRVKSNSPPPVQHFPCPNSQPTSPSPATSCQSLNTLSWDLVASATLIAQFSFTKIMSPSLTRKTSLCSKGGVIPPEPSYGASHCVRYQVCKPHLLVSSRSRLTQPQRRQPSSHPTSKPSAPTTYLASKPWSATFTQRPASQSKQLGWQPSRLATSHLGQGSPTRMPPNIALLLTRPSKVTWPSLARMSAPPSPNHPRLLPHLRFPHNLTNIRSYLPLQHAP